MSDRRWYPFSIMEKHTTTIEYKTGSPIKYDKCFMLGFESGKFDEKFGIEGGYGEFSIPYNHHTLTDEEFYSEIYGKPYFLVEIYQDGELKRKETMYMMVREGGGYQSVGSQKIAILRVRGYWGPRRAGCYHFLPNSTYTIRVTNLIPIDRYQDIDSYLGITPIPIL